MKFVIALFMLGVVGALASAGIFMLRKGRATDPHGAKMARALAIRVALSVALFLFLLFSWWMGWIQPTGVPVGR